MLGLADEAQDALALAKGAIELFGEQLPIETGHIELSEASLRLWNATPGSSDLRLDEVAEVYRRRGVDWVDSYFSAIIRTGRPPFPKRF